MRKLWDTFQAKYNEESKNLEKKIDQKKKAIYVETPSWACPYLISAYENFKLSALKYNGFTQQVIDFILSPTVLHITI